MKNFILILAFFSLTAMTCEREVKEVSIHESVRKNDLTAVKNYLENGGDPDFSIKNRGSLLYESTGPKGGFEVMKLLVENGADVNLGAGKYTPLMNASSWVSAEAVKFLLENGANPNLKNEEGKTALEVMGQCNCPEEEVVRTLLGQ